MAGALSALPAALSAALASSSLSYGCAFGLKKESINCSVRTASIRGLIGLKFYLFLSTLPPAPSGTLGASPNAFIPIVN